MDKNQPNWYKLIDNAYKTGDWSRVKQAMLPKDEPFEKKTLWYIEVGTGCSCCTDEDGFYHGFFDNPEEPTEIMERWKKGIGDDYTPMGSQYSKFGTYMLRQAEIELLPDGRIIWGSKVHDQLYDKVKFDEYGLKGE